MTFQAYLTTITEKTGLTAPELLAKAAEKGFVPGVTKAGELIAWLDADYGLGRGHAMALFALFKAQDAPRPAADERIDAQFAGAKAAWRGLFDRLVAAGTALGGDVALAPTDSYVSLTRGGKKFAIIAVTATRLDLGLKLTGEDVVEPWEASGSWNAMVTHRLRIEDAAQVGDGELALLARAYELR